MSRWRSPSPTSRSAAPSSGSASPASRCPWGSSPRTSACGARPASRRAGARGPRGSPCRASRRPRRGRPPRASTSTSDAALEVIARGGPACRRRCARRAGARALAARIHAADAGRRCARRSRRRASCSSRWTCCASSRVGVTISARGAPGCVEPLAPRRAGGGASASPNATVLPEPVCAETRRSRSARRPRGRRPGPASARRSYGRRGLDGDLDVQW